MGQRQTEPAEGELTFAAVQEAADEGGAAAAAASREATRGATSGH